MSVLQLPENFFLEKSNPEGVVISTACRRRSHCPPWLARASLTFKSRDSAASTSPESKSRIFAEALRKFTYNLADMAATWAESQLM